MEIKDNKIDINSLTLKEQLHILKVMLGLEEHTFGVEFTNKFLEPLRDSAMDFTINIPRDRTDGLTAIIVEAFVLEKIQKLKEQDKIEEYEEELYGLSIKKYSYFYEASTQLLELEQNIRKNPDNFFLLKEFALSLDIVAITNTPVNTGKDAPANTFRNDDEKKEIVDTVMFLKLFFSYGKEDSVDFTLTNPIEHFKELLALKSQVEDLRKQKVLLQGLIRSSDSRETEYLMGLLKM